MAVNLKSLSLPHLAGAAVIAIFVWSAIGFSWFGYGFDWTTAGGAQQMTATAVKEQMASICVAQARNTPDSEAALAQFAALDNWKQSSFVEESNWATMPGSDSPRTGVASLCANKLRQI